MDSFADTSKKSPNDHNPSLEEISSYLGKVSEHYKGLMAPGSREVMDIIRKMGDSQQKEFTFTAGEVNAYLG